MTTALALDPGYGNTKLFGPEGALCMPSVVSSGDTQVVGRMTGLRRAKPPLRVTLDGAVFHVGEDAHDWGRPIENLDYDRLAGSPEMMALVLGAVTQYGVPDQPVDLIVGLPIATLQGDRARDTERELRRALQTTHGWLADGVPHTMEVAGVHVTSQPVGALFDYLLTEDGQMLPQQRAIFRRQLGVLNVGMNTLELLVVQQGAPVQRFTAGGKVGVRRLLELMDPQGTYTLAELDAQLRQGALDVSAALPVWRSEVTGYLERHWADAAQRLAVIIAVGGGVHFLEEMLLRRFKERLHMPDDPIMATARGLFKYALMSARRARP